MFAVRHDSVAVKRQHEQKALTLRTMKLHQLYRCCQRCLAAQHRPPESNDAAVFDTADINESALREALLEAADGLLAERGLEGFSLREVARRSGVSPAAQAATRIPAGHPEGYLEAFATLYSQFAQVIRGDGKEFAALLPTLADGVEAASRSLRQITPEELQETVNRIVGERITDGQLDEAQLTLEEITTIVDLLLADLNKRLADRRVTVTLDKRYITPIDVTPQQLADSSNARKLEQFGQQLASATAPACTTWTATTTCATTSSTFWCHAPKPIEFSPQFFHQLPSRGLS